MEKFSLDPRLAADCIVLGEMPLSRLLLLNNSLFPWFILVPRRNAVELFELESADQLILLEEINLLSRFVKGHFGSEKLNVAAIGNIVSQMHIHVVGRKTTDCCWPGVVWGMQEKAPYAAEEIERLSAAITAAFAAELFHPIRREYQANDLIQRSNA
jgi:diadenosine tetraphosphate (Ap4A) HIT family hydrolase